MRRKEEVIRKKRVEMHLKFKDKLAYLRKLQELMNTETEVEKLNVESVAE